MRRYGGGLAIVDEVRALLFLLVPLSLVVVACGGRSSSQPARAARHPAPRPSTVAQAVRLRQHSAAVPILEYHVIGSRANGSGLEGLYVSPSLFKQQVDWLAAHGWHGVTLDAVLAYWRKGRALPRKPVVLSFDDGYPGDWQYALPVLRAHHWPGVLNLQIGNLVPMRVRQLIAGGWEIDAHTFTHPDLTTLGPAQLAHEVFDARRWIQRVFQVPVDAFCYPSGRYDAATLKEVRRAGYLAAETENAGVASPKQSPLTLDRIRVGPTTDPASLGSLLAG